MNCLPLRKANSRPRLIIAAAVVWSLAAAAQAQAGPLPPPAEQTVEFTRDIEPIFQESCLRCHGSEKPKSHFRLDNRGAAQAGGDSNTNDIVPGDSGRSLLILYVAHAVKAMEMPPMGKGAPLTPRQIGLLRAWIDQGAVWSTNRQPDQIAVAASSTVGGFDVHGNKAKFRELAEVPDGFSGGLEKFSLLQQLDANDKLSLDGHLLEPQQDMGLKLGLDKTDLGFVHAGFDQWRKYYAADGGADAAVIPSQFAVNRDLYVDNGRAWVDFGLDLPHWPRMVLGYEYDYRSGVESTLDWGDANGKNIYPATQGVDERTHILKFDLSNDFGGWHFEDSTRVEFNSEKNQGAEAGILAGGAVPDLSISTRDDYQQTQGMNTLTFEKSIRVWWLLSGGFCYSRLEGGDLFSQTTAIPAFGLNAVLNSQQITLERDSEIFSAASLFTPLDYLTFSLGSQNEWTSEQGFGASVPDLELGLNTPATSSVEEFKAAQQAGFRYTKIPLAILSGAARLEEENVNEYQEEDPAEFMRDTAANNRRYNVQLGLSVSPWRTLEWSAQIRRDDSKTDYGQLLDLYNGFYGPTNGYPAFILNRTIRSDVFETKLVWRPSLWLKATLTCQFTATDYSSKTDPSIDLGLMEQVSPGGPILDGTCDARTYGLGVTVTPLRRLYFSGAFTYSFSRAITADNDDPSIAPYRGNIDTLSAAANYALDASTSLQAAYTFSTAGYEENNAAAGVPLGLEYTRHDLSISLTRKFNLRLSGSLRYAFSQYSEPSSGNANGYGAQGVFAAMNYKFP